VTSLRRLTALAAALAAVIALAACGSDDGGSTATGSATVADGAAGTFPVTVEHEFGTTTIEKPPERVVSYGYTDQDTLLALGITPVGILQWIPEWKRGVGAWSTAALGDAQPEMLANETTPDFEAIAALRPDLISIVNYDLDRSAYEKLSRIAPTVPTVKGYPPYGTPWDVIATQVGAAVGKRDEAQRLVDEAEAAFQAVRDEHPEWAGKQVMIVTPSPEGGMYIFADSDSRGRFVSELGFEQPPEVAELTGDAFYTEISPERFDLLDGDALVMLADTTAAKASLDDMPTYQSLDVVRDGRVVTVTDLELSMALSASTPTAIPYALERLVPDLEKVLAKTE
jgi:iron complex transport system substrate-binding protein